MEEQDRLTQVVIGLITAFVGLICLLLIGFFLYDLPGENVLWELVISISFVVISIFVLTVSFRLITGKKRRDNGLLSPPILIVGGIILLVLSIFTFVMQDDADQSFMKKVAPYIYFVFSVLSFVLAKKRAARKYQHPK